LKNAGFSKSDIDEIILVGGSTRIPATNLKATSEQGGV
jgi:molecular chaperone DnaK (HSP70)